jgi:hypothetical protein
MRVESERGWIEVMRVRVRVKGEVAQSEMIVEEIR